MPLLPRPIILLRAAVAYTGACVLVVEVLATRILAPHFGSSLATLSSVLSVTLGALSLGYALGGVLGDRSPSWGKFSALVMLAGAATGIVWPLSLEMLPLIAASFGPGSGPLLSSVVLFALPCTILGALSPYAVAMAQAAAPALSGGRASGSIFFWSTLGSIAGSLAAGFLLLPALGVRAVLLLVGGSLAALGTVGLLSTARRGAPERWIFPPSLILLLFAGSAPDDMTAVYARDGVYQRIAVRDVFDGKRPIRILFQDRNPSSAVDLASEDPVFDYTRVIAAAWTGRSPPRRSLVIGAGAYVIPRMIAEATAGAVDVVDIEPGLEKIAERFFRFTPSPLVQSIVADGRVFLRSAESYDLIVGDAYQAFYAIPAHLTTREFFTLVREHLTKNGMFIGNFIDVPDPARRAYFPAALRTLRSVFPNGRSFATRDPKGTETQNILFIACRGDSCIDPCSAPFLENRDPVLSTLCSREIRASDADLRRHALLTDDYAPVEWLMWNR